MVISALAFTLLNVSIKQLKSFDVYQIVFFRSVGSLFFTIPLIFKSKLSPFGNKKGLLIIRSVVGLISMIFFFKSLKYLPMGFAVSLRYIAPIFASFFALLLLNEKVKPIQWLFFVIAFSGVLMLRGFDTPAQNIGLLFALVSAIFAGLVYIAIRKIGNQDHPLIVVNYFMIISAVVAGLMTFPNWIQPMGYELLIFLSLGLFGYFGQFYMTKAMQIGETNQVAPLKYLEVLFTIFIGLIWLNETYTIYSLFGVSLIVIGLSLNVMVKKN